jgi:hypothetical protein
MGANAGPDIVSDGLVLALDAADNNSFRGEPTENLFPNPQFLNHTNNSAGAASITKKIFDNGRVGIEMIQGSSSNIVSFSMGNLGGTGVSGGTYTWSSYINCTSTGNKLKAQVSIYVDGIRHWLTNSNTWTTSVVECSHLFSPTIANSWHRIENTFTLPTGTLTNFSLGGFYRNTSNFTIKIADAHLELNPAATRFTTGTRGTTVAAGGGWADISGNDNHGEILNGTSTSNDGSVIGALDFDGSNDYIDLGTGTLNLTNTSFTLEAIIKWDGGSEDTFFGHHYTTTQRQSIHWRIYSTGQLRFDFYSDSINSSTGAIVAGNTYYLTVTYNYNTDTCICYRNGEVLMSGTSGPFTGISASTITNIGRWFSGGPQYFGGSIYYFRGYNRALSASEVLQNYNSLKSRFRL